MWQLFVKTLNGRTLTLEVAATTTIYEVKQMISLVQGSQEIFEPNYYLVFCSRHLTDQQTIEGAKISRDSTIHIVRRGSRIYPPDDNDGKQVDTSTTTAVASASTSNTTRGCACGATGLSPTAIYCDACLRAQPLFEKPSTTTTKDEDKGTVPTTVAMVGTLTSVARQRGMVNGYVKDARFALPYHCCWDSVRQRLLVCDSANHRVRIIENDTVSELEMYNVPDRKCYPCGVTVDKVGNIYITESHCIRRISGDEMTILAGSERAGFRDGMGSSALFNDPRAIAVASDGYIYVADYFNKALRRISPTGLVTTLTKGGWPGNIFDHSQLDPKTFDYPAGVTIDKIGNVLVADGPGLWVVGMSGDVAPVAVNTVSWDGRYGPLPSAATKANAIGRLTAVVSHPSLGGHIYVTDTTFNCVRQITLDSTSRIDSMMAVPQLAAFPPGILPLIGSYFPVVGEASLLAGDASFAGLLDGEASQARFNTPRLVDHHHLSHSCPHTVHSSLLSCV